MTDRTPGASRTSGGSAGRRPRRTFSPEYKHEAARLVTDTGRSTAEVAQKLGVGSQSLASGSPPNAPRRPVNRPESCPPLDERAKLKTLRRVLLQSGAGNARELIRRCCCNLG